MVLTTSIQSEPVCSRDMQKSPFNPSGSSSRSFRSRAPLVRDYQKKILQSIFQPEKSMDQEKWRYAPQQNGGRSTDNVEKSTHRIIPDEGPVEPNNGTFTLVLHKRRVMTRPLALGCTPLNNSGLESPLLTYEQKPNTILSFNNLVSNLP